WHAFMAGALANTPVNEFKAPPGVQQGDVCALSGMLPTQECRENTLPVHGIRRDWFVPGVNLPTQTDNWHQRVEVCKVNGKRATSLVPDNAREQTVFVTLPEPVLAWGLTHGYPAAPTEDCSDVYQGEHIAQVVAPTASDQITVGQTLQIVGSAYIDDFSNYTLDFGSGDAPATWTNITDQRPQAVDKALLGVWNTTGLQPGRYRLRLRVFDSFANVQESPPLIVTLSAPPTPTPTLRPTVSSIPATPTPGRGQPTPTPAPRQPTPLTTPATPTPRPVPVPRP
ncbi:MAG TPA: hypothetical protein VGA61_22480, partial [Anaerolineae bacterium]